MKAKKTVVIWVITILFLFLAGWYGTVILWGINSDGNVKSMRRTKMILVNTENISGKELEMLGIVKGSTVQSRHIGKDLMSGLKTLVGGELNAYTEMLNGARALATKRMVTEAEELEADAVVNIRYASSAVVQGAAEVIAYGTAVKFL
jgi:uncharacterized protein YbjQ (UPF0145 family)